MIFIGGLEGISGVIDSLEGEKFSANDAGKIFDEVLVNCPEQGSRSVRTEECVLMSLS